MGLTNPVFFYLQEILTDLVNRVSETTPYKPPPARHRQPFLLQRSDPNRKSAKGHKWMVWEHAARQKLLGKKHVNLGECLTDNFPVSSVPRDEIFLSRSLKCSDNDSK